MVTSAAAPRLNREQSLQSAMVASHRTRNIRCALLLVWSRSSSSRWCLLHGVALFTSAACASRKHDGAGRFPHRTSRWRRADDPVLDRLLLGPFPRERRADAVRNWAAIGDLTAAIAPVVGGVLVTVSWYWISW
jgi:hypothetical protein